MTTKYSYKGTDPYSSHAKIAKIIGNLKNKTILDVGCNKGFIGKALRNEIKWKGKLVGIDKSNECSMVTKVGYDEFKLLDIEQKWESFPDKFDIIIFADVLEHLVNPEAVLAKADKHLKENGIILISVPNIANLYIRLSIMMGKFNYSDRGILDKDHKMFYTLSNARKMLKRSNLKTLKEEFTPIPLPILNSNFYRGQLLYSFYFLTNLISSLRPSIFAYQLIFVCKKK